jgi:hypothetical protein
VRGLAMRAEEALVCLYRSSGVRIAD